MKTQFSPRHLIMLAIVLALAGLGAYIAFITYQYKIIIRGILGLVVCYLVFQIAWYTRGTSIDTFFAFPKNIKYFVFAFVGSLIFYWGLGFIVEMILFLAR